MDRRTFLFTTLASGATVLPGCGGSTEDLLQSAAAGQPSAGPQPQPTLPPAPTPIAPPVTPTNSTSTPAPPPADTPPPPPQPTPPPSRPAEVYVGAYENNLGVASPQSPSQMFWQSAFTTKDGTLIEWGTADHGPTSDNGVREFDPATGVQTYVYPNNNGTIEQSQYDNLHYFYIPRLNSLVIPSRGQYDRATGKWPIGNLLSNGRSVVGSGSSDLFRPIGYVYLDSYLGTYNAHQAWSAQQDCGVCISGGRGGDRSARQKMWIIVPSGGVGSFVQPYAIYERVMPSTVAGVAAHKINGRDGCCFGGDYVYWVGGEESNSTTATRHFFRMKITPHLTSTSATLMIERLPDAPAAFGFGLLRYDPYANALICITNQGIFAFDLITWSWADVTPAGYRNDYAAAPTNGLLPYGCLGDFVDTRSGQTMRKFVWRPGMNHSWEYDYGGTSQARMFKRFRAIKLARP